MVARAFVACQGPFYRNLELDCRGWGTARGSGEPDAQVLGEPEEACVGGGAGEDEDGEHPPVAPGAGDAARAAATEVEVDGQRGHEEAGGAEEPAVGVVESVAEGDGLRRRDDTDEDEDDGGDAAGYGGDAGEEAVEQGPCGPGRPRRLAAGGCWRVLSSWALLAIYVHRMRDVGMLVSRCQTRLRPLSTVVVSCRGIFLPQPTTGGWAS